MTKKNSNITHQIKISTKEKKNSSAKKLITAKKTSHSEVQTDLIHLYENIPIGVYRTTPEGKFIKANKAMIKMAGFNSLSELKKSDIDIDNYFSGISRDKLKKILESKDRIIGYEYKWRKPDGSIRHLRENASVIRSKNGQVQYYDGTVEDITDQMLATEKFYKSSDSYNQLFNNTDEGIFILNKNGKILEHNSVSLKIFDHEKSNIENHNLESFIVGNKTQKETLRKKILKAYNGNAQEFEALGVRKNGENISVYLRLHQTTRAEVNVVICFVNDISTSKRSKQLLLESEESFKSLVESSADPIYVLRDSKLLLVNNAWLNLFEYKEDEVYNEKFDVLNIVAPNSTSLFKERNSNLKSGQISSLRYEMQGKTKSGTILDLEASISSVKWKGELAFQGVYRDVTAKKRIEKAIKNKDKLLESVARATSFLLTEPNIDKAIHFAFEIIGRSVNVSRIYIFENHKSSDAKEILFSQKYEWTDGTVSKEIDNQNLQNIPYSTFPGWYGKFSSGLAIKGNTKDFSEQIRAILENEGIKSILLVPIFVFSKLWGFIGFDECKYERDWSDSEISILFMAGNSFGNSLVRSQTERALIESEEKYRFLFDQAGDLIATVGLDGNFTDLNKRFEIESGWKKEDIVGKSVFECGILTEESSKKILHKLRQLIRGIEPPIFEVEGNTKDGRKIPYELKAVPIFKGRKLVEVQAILRDIRERKKSEQILRESEEKYRKIFENVQDVFFQTDIDNKISTISPSIERYTGYKPDELIGKSVTFLFATAKDRAKILKEVKDYNEIVDTIVLLKNKNEKEIIVSISAHVIKTKGGIELGIEGSIRDVTERENAYSEIRKLSRAVEQSPNSIVITDTKGKIEYINPKFSELTKYSFEEVIGKTSSILKSGEMTDQQYKQMWKTISSGKEWKGEFHNKKKTGELFWESATISPIKNEFGEISHFIAIKEDITEKKLHEKRLFNYQKLLKGVSEAVQVLITKDNFKFAVQDSIKALGIGAGADRVYLFENSFDTNTNKLLGYQKYEWTSESVSSELDNQLWQAFDYKSLAPEFFQSMLARKNYHKLTSELPKNEQELLIPQEIQAILVVPLYVNDLFWGFIGFDNCHSEEKFSADEESIISAAVASIARAIEREKTKEELVHAKEEAEKAERLKSEFLAQISHEIRSPLNVLLNYAQFIKGILSNTHNEEMMLSLDGMESAGNRIIRTIDLILNLSEVQSGAYDFQPRKIDIDRDVISQLFYEYKKLAMRKDLDFIKTKKTDSLFIRGDEYSITQIFANLIDNAIKYTHRGQIEIIIERDNLDRLIIKVCDTGIGISKEYLPSVFSAFSQEEQGYTRSYEGNGLGLALVKKYCELNNARIHVDSRKGYGTTFTITFD